MQFNTQILAVGVSPAHRPSILRFTLTVLTALWLAACSASVPGGNGIGHDTQVVAIARKYAVDHNLVQAQTDLDKLKLANTSGYTSLLAEQLQTKAGSQDDARAVAELALALGARNDKLAQLVPSPTLVAAATQAPSPVPADTVAPTVALAVSAIPATATLAPATATSLPSTATSVPASATPLQATDAATDVPTAAPTPLAQPTATVNIVVTSRPVAVPYSQYDFVYLRNGPGVNYPIAGTLAAGNQVDIIGRNGEWWKVCCSEGAQVWVAASIVETQGPVNQVAVVNAPPTPLVVVPTRTPAPTSGPALVNLPPTLPPTARPIVSLPPTALPATAAPTPKPSTNTWNVSVRMWSNAENGGGGPPDSPRCGNGRNIHVTVLDENGIRINGVRIVGVWTKIIKVTGADGKGDGNVVMDFPQHSGEQVQIEGTSAVSPSLEIEDEKIPIPWLIAGGYCTDQASCQQKVSQNRLCRYHYSYDVIFRKS